MRQLEQKSHLSHLSLDPSSSSPILPSQVLRRECGIPAHAQCPAVDIDYSCMPRELLKDTHVSCEHVKQLL